MLNCLKNNILSNVDYNNLTYIVLLLYKQTNIMARKKTKEKVEKIINEIKNSTPKFKLQVDNKTIITLKTQEQLDKWMSLYPKAKLIS